MGNENSSHSDDDSWVNDNLEQPALRTTPVVVDNYQYLRQRQQPAELSSSSVVDHHHHQHHRQKQSQPQPQQQSASSYATTTSMDRTTHQPQQQQPASSYATMASMDRSTHQPQQQSASSYATVASMDRTTHHHPSTHQHQRFDDNYSSLDEVISELRNAGLESSNLILGIDFTKSNEWTGKYSFNRKSLHAIGSTPNPYEQAISIIGRTLSPFDEDNLIPCFGFGDASTHDKLVFSFYSDNRYCHGFEEVLARYREIVPHLNLSGPTSFAPVIDAAIDIVEESDGQYHVLVIIADGQVTRNPGTPPGRFSNQEQATVNSIVAASHYPLSIILVGVGDGPWDAMHEFDDNIPQRTFDNFQFVNFTKIMSDNKDTSKKESAFALAALMEIPLQYKATLCPSTSSGRVGGPRTRPLPPPREIVERDNAIKSWPQVMSSTSVEPNASLEPVCPICLTNPKNMAFGCGHLTCKECSSSVSNCPICREPITTRLRLYS